MAQLPVDLATLIVAGKTTSGVCVDIFDGDNGMEGAPQEPLAVANQSHLIGDYLVLENLVRSYH